MSDDAGDINLSLESFKGFIGKIVQYSIGFVGTILFARLLGPTSFGGFYTLLSLVYLSDQPLRGIVGAIEKRFSEAEANRNQIVGAVIVLYLAAYLVVGVALIFAAEPLAAETNVPNAPFVFFALFTTLTTFVASQQLLAAGGRPALQIWNDTVRSMLTFPLQLGFILAGFGAAGMGYGLVGASLLTIPVAHYVVRVRPERPSREVLRSIWEYARYSVPGAIVSTAYSRLDLLLIGFILSTGAAGQYEIAYKLTVPATLVSTAVAPALFPKLSNLHSRGEEIGSDLSNTLAFASLLSIPIFFGALAIPEGIVVTIYGGPYREAATLLLGLALYQVFQTQVRMYARTVGAIDRPDLNFWINAATLLFNVVVGIALIFEFGAFGVVVATVLAEALRYVLYVGVSRRLISGVTVLPRELLEQVAAGAAMFAVVEFVNGQVPIRGWPDLLFVVGTGAVVYGAVLLIISRGLRVTLESVLEDIVAYRRRQT